MILTAILIPVAVGLLIQTTRPLVAKRIVKLLKPFYILIVLYMSTLGLYTNVYLFQLFTPSLMIAACMLPYIGFTLGALVSIVTCQPLNRKIALTIETGMQSTGIPLMLLKYSLPQPEADLAVVAPIMISMFTPLPLLLVFTVKELYKYCCKRTTFEEVPACDEEETEEKIPAQGAGALPVKSVKEWVEMRSSVV